MNRVEFVKQSMFGKILNIGCSYGNFHREIFNKNVHGIDQFPCDIKENFTLYDVEKGLPYNDGSFDTVIAGEIIESLKNLEFFLKEIKRILKLDGILILSTPNKNSLINRIFKTYQVKEHINLMSIEEVESLTSRYLTIEKLFCLPFDEDSNPTGKFRSLRKLTHPLLPKSLQEDIIILSRKR